MNMGGCGSRPQAPVTPAATSAPAEQPKRDWVTVKIPAELQQPIRRQLFQLLKPVYGKEGTLQLKSGNAVVAFAGQKNVPVSFAQVTQSGLKHGEKVYLLAYTDPLPGEPEGEITSYLQAIRPKAWKQFLAEEATQPKHPQFRKTDELKSEDGRVVVWTGVGKGERLFAIFRDKELIGLVRPNRRDRAIKCFAMVAEPDGGPLEKQPQVGIMIRDPQDVIHALGVNNKGMAEQCIIGKWENGAVVLNDDAAKLLAKAEAEATAGR